MPQFCAADKMKPTAGRQDADLKIQHVSCCCSLEEGRGLQGATLQVSQYQAAKSSAEAAGMNGF